MYQARVLLSWVRPTGLVLLFSIAAFAQQGPLGGGSYSNQTTSAFQMGIFIFTAFCALAAICLFMLAWFGIRRGWEHGIGVIFGAAAICVGLAITPYLVGYIWPAAKSVAAMFG